jgi:hypothetical protein
VRIRARVLLLVASAALVVVSAANAKFKLSLSVSDASPRVAQPITVVLRSGVPLSYDLKLIAVAPGKSWYDVVGVVTGDSAIAKARIPHDGFGVPVVRTGPNRWRAQVSFPRPGRWRLIIPNGAKEGFMIPPPVVRWSSSAEPARPWPAPLARFAFPGKRGPVPPAARAAKQTASLACL